MLQLKIGSFELNASRKSYDGTGSPAGSGAPGTYFYSPSFGPAFSEFFRRFGSFKSVLRGGYIDENLTNIFYIIPEVFAPINTVAKAVIKGRIELCRVKDDEIVTDNKFINKFLSNPNPLRTFREFFWEAVVHEIVTGNAYQYSPMSNMLTPRLENMDTWWNLPSYMVQPKMPLRFKLFSSTKIDEIIPEYTFSYGGNEPITIPANLMFHLKNPNLSWDHQPFKGKSCLWAAEYPISNLVAVYEARNVIYVKRGSLGMIVSRRTDTSGQIALGKGEKEKLEKEFIKSHGITDDKIPFSITDQPIDYVKIAMSIQELEPFKETEASAKAIFGVLQVPEDLMPGAQGGTFENQRIAERRLYDNVAIPMGERFVEGWNSWFNLREKGLYLRIRYNHIEALQENKKEKAQVEGSNAMTRQLLFISGIITLNQWLTLEGQDQATLPIYDKRTFEMDPTELEQVKVIMNLAKPAANISIGGLNNDSFSNNPTNSGA